MRADLRARASRAAREAAIQREVAGKSRHVPPKVLPRASHPKVAEAAYAKAIIGSVVDKAREALKPLLAELPTLLASARKARERVDEFDPDQPRGADGQWSKTGAGGPKALAARVAAAQAREHGWGQLARSPEQIEKDVHAAASREETAAAVMREQATELVKAQELAREKPPTERLADPKAAKDLAERRVVGLKPLSTGANSSEVATLDDGSKALWKPQTGERSELRDNVQAGTYYRREVAASAVAENLGVADMVPAVVTHTITPLVGTASAGRGDTVGALQAWVKGTPMMDLPEDAKFTRDSAERMRVYDFVTGNSDRHDGNVLMGEGGKAMLIDHGLSFPSGRPARFIQPMPAVPMHGEDLASHAGLLPSTREQIAKIDLPRLAKTLHDNGIDHEAIRQTLMRAAYLKANPLALAITKASLDAQETLWHDLATGDMSAHSAEANPIVHALPKETR